MRQYKDDDGRTVADMSGLPGSTMGGWLPLRRPKRPEAPKEAPKEADERPEENEPINGRVRLWYTLGAMGASLLVGLAFLIGLGLVILLMLMLWT